MREVTMFILLAIICFLIGLGIGVSVSKDDYYKQGQLDYQRGIVKYELTDNGYVEYFEEGDK